MVDTGTNSRPLRIYWLTEAFYPPIVGGQEMFAGNITKALAERGATVSVITRQSVPAAAPRERVGLVDVRRIPPAGVLKGKGWSAVFPVISYLLRLFWMLLTEARNFDVVMVSGVKLMPLIVVPICLLTGKKCILRAESFFELKETVSAESLREMHGSAGKMLVAVMDRLRRWMLVRAGAVIAISSEIHNALNLRGIEDNHIRRIPNAVDLKKFSPVSPAEQLVLRERHGLPKERTLLIFSGRLSRAKGLPMLMEAWPTLLQRFPGLCLVIVGSGKLSFDDCEAEMKQFVSEHGLQREVLFLGESDRVHELLQASDLFVFPTEYEGFSLALVEALGSGIPVVVTAVGAAPDLIKEGQNGFLFSPKDKGALIAALDGALRQRDRWPAITAAARSSVMVYDIGVVADQYLELAQALHGADGRAAADHVGPK
jgi:glycosyltransferase involved in cell wall biosynthesis